MEGRSINGNGSAQPGRDLHRIASVEMADDVTQGFDLQRYVAIAKRRWRMLLVFPLLSIAYVFYYEAKRVPKYTAQAMLIRQSKNTPLSPETGKPAVQTDAQRIPTELEIIRSVAISGKVVDSLGLRVWVSPAPVRQSQIFSSIRTDPYAPIATYELRKSGQADAIGLFQDGKQVAVVDPSGAVSYNGLHVQLAERGRARLPVWLSVGDRADTIDGIRFGIIPTQVRLTPVIRLNYSHPDPEKAAAIVNAVAYTYVEHDAERARADAAKRRHFLEASLARLGDSLELAKTALSTYQESSESIDPAGEGQVATVALNSAENDLRTMKFQEGVLQSLLTSLQASNPNDRALQRLVAISKEIVPAIDGFFSDLKTLDTERLRLTSGRFGYTSQGRSVQTIDSLITVTRGDMRGATEEALLLLRKRIRDAEQNAGRLRTKVVASPRRATSFLALQQDVDGIRRTYDQLADRVNEVRLTEAVEVGDVEIIDHAKVPSRPDGFDRTRALIMALIVGLGLAGAALTTMDKLDRRIRTSYDALRATSSEVLGVVPDFSKRDARSISSGLEAYRRIRTAVRFARAEQPAVIAVTSAAPGEGKSVTASNLAQAMAESGLKVLLVDAAFRRPMVHTLFNRPGSPGLSDVLSDNATLDSVLVAHGAVTLLPSGSTSPRPAELLSGPGFEKLLTELRRRFEAVIVDTSPVHEVADASIIATQADGVVLVAQAEATDRKALEHAVQRLRQARADILGVVMNRVPVGLNSYGSDYGYYEYTPRKGHGASAELIMGPSTGKVQNRIKQLLNT